MKFLTLTLLLFLMGSLQNILAQDKNKSIIAYVDSQVNEKVDRGECWDLIAFALDYAKADWEMPLEFGEPLDYKKDVIKPGDIITFDNVKFQNDSSYCTFPQHYAIVYKVHDKSHFTIAHQNHNNVRKVQFLDIYLNDLKKGKLSFARAR